MLVFFSYLQMINSLDYGLAKVADLMIKNVVSPIICDRFKTPLIEELSWDSDEKATAILQILPSPELQVPTVLILFIATFASF